jgi:hypothetical protein
LRTAFHRNGRANVRRFSADDIPVLYRHLSSRTKHIFDLTVPDQLGAFVSLAQHHGYPTPLLDWTYSPFIAAFFSYRRRLTEHEIDGSDDKVRIFILDLNAWATDTVQRPAFTIRGPHLSIMRFPAINNDRLIPQQSVSTVTNLDDIESFIRYMEAQRQKTYLRVVDLPKSERAIVMRDLSVMGITAGSMMPGLDGACEELFEQNFPTPVA